MHKMEQAALQHSDQKKAEQVQEDQGRTKPQGVPLSKQETAFVLKCVATMKVNDEEKLSESVRSVLTAGKDEPLPGDQDNTGASAAAG
jgi:hypothetical protein